MELQVRDNGADWSHVMEQQARNILFHTTLSVNEWALAWCQSTNIHNRQADPEEAG